MLHNRGLKLRRAGKHIAEIEKRAVGQAKHNIQIAQPHIRVDADHASPERGKARRDASRNGGLPGSALSGGHDHCLSHKKLRSRLRLTRFLSYYYIKKTRARKPQGANVMKTGII
jgi:hypothetical protein